MPVIINDFEIIPEPPAPTQQPEPQPTAPSLTPEDIERLMVFFAERWARLIAD